MDAGTGRPEDLAGLNLDGALALVRRSDDVAVAEQSNRAAAAGARMVAVYNDQPGSSGVTGAFGVKLEVPTVRLSHEEGRALLDRSDAGPVTLTATGTPSSPYRYDLVHAYDGSVPADLHHVAETDDLAAVERDFHVQVDGTLTELSVPFAPGADFGVGTSYPVRDTPVECTDYYVANPETTRMDTVTTPELATAATGPS